MEAFKQTAGNPLAAIAKLEKNDSVSNIKGSIYDYIAPIEGDGNGYMILFL